MLFHVGRLDQEKGAVGRRALPDLCDEFSQELAVVVGLDAAAVESELLFFGLP